MGCVTRLGAKCPAIVARFRGGTASQRCRSKRSRCATPPKPLKNRMCGITSKKNHIPHSQRAHGPDTLYCSSLSSAESSCSSAASKLRPSPCAVTLRLFVGDLAHTQGRPRVARRSSERREDGWSARGRAKALFRASLASIWRNCCPKRRPELWRCPELLLIF
eukprot:scaffold30158_cov66-Phaeocystis_antarctica.AAC.3